VSVGVAPVRTIAAPSGQALAVVVRANWSPNATEFVTPDTYNLQMGAIVYGRGQSIVAHMHLPVVREVRGTNEVVMVRRGCCEVDLYDDQRAFAETLRLDQGDVLLLLGGGGHRAARSEAGSLRRRHGQGEVYAVIPVNEPLLLDEDFESVNECLRSGWVSSAGPQLEQFERDWAAYCGVSHGVAVSNGTTGLQVAVEAVGIGPGDEVILPSFTIISCVSAVLRAGGTPVLVDCDPITFCMDPEQVAERVTPRTRAIMVVHMYGHPVDMDPILALARRHGLRVIEDAAEVHGAEYLSARGEAHARWRRCGGMGDIATFSFFANKLITTGEGGMVITADDGLARRCRSLRNLCFQPSRRFLHDEHGWQFRMTSLQAALGLRQIGRMDDIMARKRLAAQEYTRRLADLSVLQLPHQCDWARSVFWVYGLVLSDAVPFDAQELARRLAARGVETRPFFLGMHEQPVFHRMGLFEHDSHPVTERIARRGLYLPSGLALTELQIDAAAAATREVLREYA
jgi:perosamine synthetase